MNSSASGPRAWTEIQFHHECVLSYLALSLLVSEIFTDHHDATITTNDFALVANLLHAWFDLHGSPLVTTCTDKRFDLW